MDGSLAVMVTNGSGEWSLRDLLAARLAEKGVRLGEQDLADVTAGYSTLQEWRAVLTALLQKPSEPDVIFEVDRLGDRGGEEPVRPQH